MWSDQRLTEFTGHSRGRRSQYEPYVRMFTYSSFRAARHGVFTTEPVQDRPPVGRSQRGPGHPLQAAIRDPASDREFKEPEICPRRPSARTTYTASK
jgi:hypothetical protein